MTAEPVQVSITGPSEDQVVRLVYALGQCSDVVIVPEPGNAPVYAGMDSCTMRVSAYVRSEVDELAAKIRIEGGLTG